jgi:hypothetical protein
VYLPAYLRVRRATCGPFAAVVERMMASGRIAADVARVVEKAVPGPQKEDVYDLLD